MLKSEIVKAVLELRREYGNHFFGSTLYNNLFNRLLEELEGFETAGVLQFRDRQHLTVLDNTPYRVNCFKHEVVKNILDVNLESTFKHAHFCTEIFEKKIPEYMSETKIKAMSKAELFALISEVYQRKNDMRFFDELLKDYAELLHQLIDVFMRNTICVYLDGDKVFFNGVATDYSIYKVFNKFVDKKSDRTPDELRLEGERNTAKRIRDYEIQAREYAHDNS